jgi:two-component system, LytTR family, sensor kinase
MPQPVGPPPNMVTQGQNPSTFSPVNNIRFERTKLKPLFFPIMQAQSLNFVVIILLELFLLRNRKQQMENENNQLRMANLQAKNSQLIQQLHPHFLFNSLNSLKTLIRKSPDRAEDYLLKMADLLRYSSKSADKNIVKLKEELNIAKNYLQMQQVRFGETLFFSINVDEELIANGSVPVFSIQLLLENAIKHNIVTMQQPLEISITGDTTQHIIRVSNNLQEKETVFGKAGIGLQNLAERYKLIGLPPPEITKNGGYFSVSIKVLQNESSHS